MLSFYFCDFGLKVTYTSLLQFERPMKPNFSSGIIFFILEAILSPTVVLIHGKARFSFQHNACRSLYDLFLTIT